MLSKVEDYGIELTKQNPKLKELLETFKELENQGYQYEGAEGSLELLMRKAVGRHQPSFELLGFRVIVEKRNWKKRRFRGHRHGEGRRIILNIPPPSA